MKKSVGSLSNSPMRFSYEGMRYKTPCHDSLFMSWLVFLLGNSQVTATEPQGKKIIFEKGECISQKNSKII